MLHMYNMLVTNQTEAVSLFTGPDYVILSNHTTHTSTVLIKHLVYTCVVCTLPTLYNICAHRFLVTVVVYTYKSTKLYPGILEHQHHAWNFWVILYHETMLHLCIVHNNVYYSSDNIKFSLMSSGSKSMEVLQHRILCYSVPLKQLLVVDAYLFSLKSCLCYLIPIVVCTCIPLKQLFPGMGHKNGLLHWKVHHFIVLFKFSLLQNPL